ncbi:MAG: response regulator [Treponema sp.]|jgi:putative two-component system response regulator|nr:response regulator [Treponema sp.]
MMKKLLVVDDNVSFLKQVSVLLEGQYELFLTKSGAMALKIGAQEKPDLILLDVEMPEMDGFETIARLKKEAWFGSTPVVFISGNQDEATKAKAFESGAADIISKPVEKEILLNRIELNMRDSGDAAKGQP